MRNLCPVQAPAVQAPAGELLKHPTSLPSSDARSPPPQGLWISAQPRGSGHSYVIHTDAHINTFIPAVAIFRVLFTSQPPLLQFPLISIL